MEYAVYCGELLVCRWKTATCWIYTFGLVDLLHLRTQTTFFLRRAFSWLCSFCVSAWGRGDPCLLLPSYPCTQHQRFWDSPACPTCRKGLLPLHIPPALCPACIFYFITFHYCCGHCIMNSWWAVDYVLPGYHEKCGRWVPSEPHGESKWIFFPLNQPRGALAFDGVRDCTDRCVIKAKKNNPFYLTCV